VNWTATGDGSVSSASSTTDGNGVAQVVHTLGPLTGRQLVHASVPRLPGSPVEFEATAGPGRPVALHVDRGDGQLALVNEALQPYAVRVEDAYGNAVSGIAIDWAVIAGGAIDPLRSLTGVDGYPYGGIVASATHTLGPAGGIHGARATASEVAGSPTVSFTATAADEIVHPLNDYTSFDWPDVTVPVGKTVAWTWTSDCWYYYYYCGSGIEHNVTFEDDPEEPVSSASAETGVHLRTFNEAAVIRYRCTIHSTSFTDGMVGTVVVYAPGT
jgi:plastocyanin